MNQKKQKVQDEHFDIILKAEKDTGLYSYVDLIITKVDRQNESAPIKNNQSNKNQSLKIVENQGLNQKHKSMGNDAFDKTQNDLQFGQINAKRGQRQKQKEAIAKSGLQYSIGHPNDKAIDGQKQRDELYKKDYDIVDFPINAGKINDNLEIELNLTEEEILERNKIELENLLQKQYQNQTIVIPSCSQWFDFSKIHELEMTSMPEFFCDKFPHKNPETYMNYRNFIIKLYRENTSSYLSATECRKKLPGDICSILRLHGFLEHWGLINFSVDSALKPAKVQLGESGIVNPQIIDVAAKGYINVAEAKKIQNIFDQKTGIQLHDIHASQGPQNNLFLIANMKIKAISTNYTPTCNFCGNLCDNKVWYRKKPSSDSFLKSDEKSLADNQETNSIHQVLKNICGSYLICKECFDLQNFPSILGPQDFERTNIQSMLIGDDFNFKQYIEKDLDEKKDKNQWTQEEIETLIDGISQHQNDWDLISVENFQRKRSAEECVLKFLELPLTENILAKVRGINQDFLDLKDQLIQSKNQKISQQAIPSVFMDTSNPLFTQVAIFSKCLEEREEKRTKELEQKLIEQRMIIEQGKASLKKLHISNQSFFNNNKVNIDPAEKQPHAHQQVIEKRTTRRMQKQIQKSKELDNKNQDLNAETTQKGQDINNIENNPLNISEQDEQLFLVDPQKKQNPPLSDEILDKITRRIIKRCRKLMKRAKREIQNEMNEIIIEQMEKVETKYFLINQMKKVQKIQEEDLSFHREQSFIDRCYISTLKTNNHQKHALF